MEKQGSQHAACSKTIKELYLKNKRAARDIMLQRKLQDQEVQVASENHRRRRAPSCPIDSAANQN